jgi:hypothetical protein
VLRWAEVHDSKRYLRIVRALWRFWDLRGLLAEGYAQLGQAIAITNQAANEDVVFAEDRVLASATAAFMARNLEDYRQAALLAEQTIQAVNSRANPSIPPSITLQRALSIGYFVKGAAHLELNQPAAALRFLSDARALFEETHDYGFAGTTWVFFGFEAEQRNDLNAARECMERGLALTRKSGDGRRIAHALVRLGFVALAAGDADHAQRFFEETYALAQAIRDRSYLSNCKFLMGRAALFRDDFAYAASLLNDPLLTGSRSARAERGWAFAELAKLAWATGSNNECDRYAEQALAIGDEAAIDELAATALYLRARMACSRQDEAAALRYLNAATTRFENSRREGLCLCLEGFAVVAQSRGENRYAIRLLAARSELRSSRFSLDHYPFMLRARHERVNMLRRAVGESEFESEWARGAKLSEQEALRLAQGLR